MPEDPATDGTEPADGEPSDEAPSAEDADALEAAIAENPEAVADFVRRLDAVNELLDVVALGEGALTDDMVVELANTGSTLAESADEIATEETVALAGTVGANGEELADAMETIVELQRSGALDDLAELAGVASLATAALDDEMVRSLAATGSSLGEVADSAAEPATRDGIETLLASVGEAEQQPADAVGAIGLLRATRDPEVQHGLGYVLALARALGRTKMDAEASQ